MSTLDTDEAFQANAKMVYQSLDEITAYINNGKIVDSKLMVMSTLSLTRAVMMVYERLSQWSDSTPPEELDHDQG